MHFILISINRITYSKSFRFCSKMNGETEENFAIGWNRLHLRVIGAWPDPNNKDERISKFVSLLIAINMLLFISIPQTVNLFVVWPDLELITENLSTANLTITITVIKLYAVCSKKEVLKPIIASISKDWSRKKNDMHMKIMRINAELSRKIFVYCLFGTSATVVSFFVQQTYLNIRGFYEVRRWFYQSFFPYGTSESPAYELTCFFQFTGGTFAGLVYSGVVSFFGMLILHLRGQFSILQLDIKSIINSHGGTDSNEFKLKLKFIVEQHENLNSFASTIEETFNGVFLLEMITVSIQLCLQGYIVLATVNAREGVSTLQLLFLTIYVIAVLANLYVICYMGEKLEIACSELGFSVYDSEWYNLTAEEARNIIMLLQRTRKPLQITAGKFCAFSLQTFAQVIKKSVSYLSVLLTVNQKIQVHE
ncbi:odorant receptor 4-like [Belonocnema kinseyi]|uniref:odorant receptor 4-like n=1 Tax=Belonocnema kinseyi TaxID=2817044 RepID=UPI00143DE1A8|nr:odorant receptor 4-like [Belonocnema kinseyi]